MTKRKPSLINIAILAYCAFNSRELWDAWTGTHLEQYSWIIILTWCLPIFLYWAVPSLFPKDQAPGTLFLLVAALAFSLIGVIGSLNILQHIGLALALAAMLPWSWKLIPWVLAAVSWMPAFGWFGIYGTSSWLFPARLLLATLGTLWVIITYGINDQKEVSQ